ncbi:MAG: NADH-quinone oxidoreductase subunit L [Acidimicrobiia bacterium]
MSAHDVLNGAWIVPALPFAGAVILLLIGKRMREPWAGVLATLMMGLSFVYAVAMFFSLRSLPAEERLGNVHTLFTWIAAGRFEVSFGTLVDPLSMAFVLFISGIATLIHLYSIGYMHGDPRFSRFFAYLNLFAASMLVLVLGSSYLTTFLGWEGVGLCSYLLISFWFERTAAAVGGKKAFVTNRVGDFGVMLAMFLIFGTIGSLDYVQVNQAAGTLAAGTATAIALLLFLGAAGKSAQFPMHIWLPDAMEGPTPVSALIHAATMVTAGVYLIARAAPIVSQSGGTAGTVIALVGAGTALYAATAALVQNDIKRVLAYSTVSQLGFMFLALGVGAFAAAIFHVITHAFFKATLFLGSGSVIHESAENQDIRTMGGMRKYLPITSFAFIVAWLAIAGVPPFSGFWSKDEILGKAFAVGGWEGYLVWGVGLLAALLTAFYMSRETLLVFFGNERFRAPADAHPHPHDPTATFTVGPDDPPHPPALAHDPHETPPTMWIPVLVLGVLAIIGGVLALPFHGLEFLTEWLEPVFAYPGAPEIPHEAPAVLIGLAVVAVVIAATGIAMATKLYRKGLVTPDGDPLPKALGHGPTRFLAHAWYIDDAVARVVGGPLRAVATWTADVFDQRIIDGAVNGVGWLFRTGGEGLRRVQTGRLRQYALWIMIGVVVIVSYLVVRFGDLSERFGQ